MMTYLRQRTSRAAFTLTELLVASAIFTMMMAGIVALNLFSARSTSGVTRMLDLGAKANVLNLICNDVKNAQTASVRNYTNSLFTTIPLATPQRGNALQVVVPVGTNTQTIYYYVDPSGDLWRWNSSSATNTAKRYITDITNRVVFSSDDFSGAIISNSIARTLIDVNLFVIDENPRDFRQILNLRASAEVRNW